MSDEFDDWMRRAFVAAEDGCACAQRDLFSAPSIIRPGQLRRLALYLLLLAGTPVETLTAETLEEAGKYAKSWEPQQEFAPYGTKLLRRVLPIVDALQVEVEQLKFVLACMKEDREAYQMGFRDGSEKTP